MIGAVFSPLLLATIEATQLVAGKISKRMWSTEISQREHPTFGTSSTSDTDKEAERIIIEMLLDKFPHAVCVGEESAKQLDPKNILDAELAFWIDPRDGTTEDSHELPFWCVSVGYMEHGCLTGGAVCAPDVRGGLTIAAEDASGVHLAERGGSFCPIELAVQVPEGTKPVIHLGLDVLRQNTYYRFLGALPKELKPRGISTSGALGLALVAAGRIDAIVQSPQMPWDFAAGMAMLLEQHNGLDETIVAIPFRTENGSVKVSLNDPENFRTDKQMMGFVAGKEKFVEPLFGLLEKNFGD